MESAKDFYYKVLWHSFSRVFSEVQSAHRSIGFPMKKCIVIVQAARVRWLMPSFVTMLSILTFFVFSGSAEAQTTITIGGGLATPNNKINDVYNGATISDDANKTWEALRGSTRLGYDLAARVRFTLSDNLQFSGGAGFSRFPQSDIKIVDPATKDTILSLKSTQNVFPLSAGVDYFIVRTIVSPYIGAELEYNYISSTVDYDTGTNISVPLNLNTAPVDSRVGFAVGAGLMLDLALVAVNVDVRYHLVNLIGRTSEESTKSYLGLNLGVCFGWE